ncbi:MAG: TonB-dependent receptor [Candidatus Aminicenantes bacterium]|nr:TonB-dependent receptor [Candidatus Aminicenantes bacterium]
MKTKALIGLIVLIFIISPVVFAQSRDTGAIVGKVTDDEGTALPGVSVVLSSPNLMGARTAITDGKGDFRFPAIPPGEYSLKADLTGFGTVVRENIRVTTTTTLSVNITMRMSTMTEEITVVGQSPTVDVKSTETASVTLSNEILRNIPYNQFTANIVNLAPGVTDNVAYGASQDTGIAYTMDGVNVADPEAGSAWVFSDHNIIEEAKIMGVGLPAEYGNFTGVIFNLVTKSGGNELSGHFEFDFQGYRADSSFWQATNNAAYVHDFPGLTPPSSKLMDVSGHLGGPIIKDKLWFYVGGQFYRTQNRPSGFPEDVDYKQPRFFAKLSTQLTPKLSISGVFQTTAYQGKNREASATRSPEACLTQDSPDWLASFSLTEIVSTNTFFDLKVNYYQGIYYLDPEVGMDPYAHTVRFVDPGFEAYTNRKRGMRYDSAGSFYYADRHRFGANASLTHYAEDFIAGSHDFKFGVEVERSGARSRFGFSGRGGELGNNVRYVDAWGYGPYGYIYSGNYMAYQYEGYDTNTRYTRVETFVQDSWQISDRLNVSLGLRFGQNWGQVKDVDGNVFKSNHLDPRVGFTFDVLGDKTTILKAHFGRFAEAMLTAYLDRMNPLANFSDYAAYYFTPDDNDPNTNTGYWTELYRIPNTTAYEMDSGIKHPYMAQFTVGIERELFRDTSVGITYINRKWNNIIGHYDRAARYNQIDYYSADLDKTFQIYERTEDSLETTNFLITNLKKSAEFPNILLDPYRKYEGIEILFNKRVSNRWQLLASYVYSKASGTRDNSFGGDIAWGEDPSDPNSYVNAEGNLTNDFTHMFKLQGTYILPLDISLSAYFRAITGPSWTTQLGAPLNQGYTYFFAEPRGSNHYPMEKTLDIRLEKIFTLAGKYRLGVIFDVFNVFNDDTVTAWGTVPGEDWFAGESPSTDGHDLYGIARPRQARLGIRVRF